MNGLSVLKITGLETNVNFLIDLARHPSFKEADVHTGFIPQHFDTLFLPLSISDTVLCQAAVAIVLNELKFKQNSAASGRSGDAFVIESGFRINHVVIRRLNLKFNDKGDLIRSACSN